MKELVIISGKGGTGKTSITAALAALASNCVLADCDVDAADLHLVTGPDIRHEDDFVGGRRAVIRQRDCHGCGRCYSLCRFGAIEPIEYKKAFQVKSAFCEGCKVCVEFCPAGAIDFVEAVNGRWFISETRFGPMVHAALGIAQENSGKLVSLIRKEAKQLAEKLNRDWILVDGSPGIGCPVIASLTGADLALVVTEPTQSGRHDLLRILELIAHFKIPAAICINKWDINPDVSADIEKFATDKRVPVISKIAYDPIFTKAQIQAKAIPEVENGEVTENIRTLWNNLKEMVQ